MQFTAALGLASYRFWYGTAENENNSQYGSNQSTTEGHAFQGTAKPIDCQGEQQELPPPYESVYEVCMLRCSSLTDESDGGSVSVGRNK